MFKVVEILSECLNQVVEQMTWKTYDDIDR